MEIIKRGTPPSEKIWVGECGHCVSVAEATQGELTNIKHDPQSGSYSWEKCPVCGAGEVIDGENWGGMCFHPKGTFRRRGI